MSRQRVRAWWRAPTVIGAFWLLAVLPVWAGVGSMVYNGSFDEVGDEGVPVGWRAFGLSQIEQRLMTADDPDRGKVACLRCTRFVPGSSDSHAMIAQTDYVTVRQGQWYRLALWARSAHMPGEVVSVALTNCKVWSEAGLSDSFAPSEQWQPFEFTFRASQDLAPHESRLQVWFKSTGSLYLDDVELVETVPVQRRWKPLLTLDGVKNAIPNSSFECGATGWGSGSPGGRGVGGPFELVGELDDTQAVHGRCSWKVSLCPEDIPVRYSDYYQPVAAPQRAILVGHEGWVPVVDGGRYVFSAYVMADRPNLPVLLVVQEAEGRGHERSVTVGTQWQRVEVAFTAQGEYASGFVGLDLRRVEPPEGTVWIDAVQFEEGERATAYEPHRALEAFVDTDSPTGIFVDPEAGLKYRLSAYNDSGAEVALRGRVTVTDFLDRLVSQAEVAEKVPAKGALSLERSAGPGRLGFFQLAWEPEGGRPQSVRAAVIQPAPEGDAAFGFNHAFPWPFLIDLSHLAGMRWWRDWSVKWQTVQPEPGGFDFRIPDEQIDRVLARDGLMVVLLPFPSAEWATTVDWEKVDREAGQRGSTRQRLPAAFKPNRLSDFAAYVRASVEHYRGRTKVFEILNEPLFTNYALPARFGYVADDYVDLLQAAYQAAKEVDPECVVIGGISGSPDMGHLDRFIELGGMQWCDVLNYHAYPGKGWAETCEESYRRRWEQLKARGEARPIWMTEFGVYGDDDPPVEPPRVGDGTMNNAARPGELEAAADLVRFAAILRACGVEKIFYHAGTAGGLHGSSAGNIFFRYGGRPRKQYAAQAALANLLGPQAEFVRKWAEPDWLQAYEFRSAGRTVVVLWTRSVDAPPLAVPAGLMAHDLMGNPVDGSHVEVTAVPLYLVGR